MQAVSLSDVVNEQLTKARSAHSGRSAVTVYGGHEHVLRQTVIALAADNELAEHESPPEATLQVLRGSVRLSTQDDAWDGTEGDLAVIPNERHSLHAISDAAVLLTVRRK